MTDPYWWYTYCEYDIVRHARSLKPSPRRYTPIAAASPTFPYITVSDVITVINAARTRRLATCVGRRMCLVQVV